MANNIDNKDNNKPVAICDQSKMDVTKCDITYRNPMQFEASVSFQKRVVNTTRAMTLQQTA